MLFTVGPKSLRESMNTLAHCSLLGLPPWSQAAKAKPQRRTGWDKPVTPIFSLRKLRILSPFKGPPKKNIIFCKTSLKSSVLRTGGK